MNTKRLFILMATVLFGLAVIPLWLWLLTGRPNIARAAPVPSQGEGGASLTSPEHQNAVQSTADAAPMTTLTVCPSVQPACDYDDIQNAVDAASDGDVIKIASGTYTGVQARDGATQTVFLSKTITIRGGYTITNWITSDPVANPTTLDAQGQGRVLYITGGISPIVEGLRITGGDASGLGGGLYSGDDAGGGVYVITATASISNNQVFSNTANNGGGIFFSNSEAILSNNKVYSNTADYYGGGMSLNDSNATIRENTVTSNTASTSGGGFYLNYSNPTISNNTVSGNVGIGLSLYRSAATLNANIVSGNSGSGLYLDYSNATVNGNTVSGNSTSDNGGGVYLYESDAALTNNIIADNQADVIGGGLYITDSSPRLIHNTITRNQGGDGSGVYVTGMYGGTTVALTNTILVSQTVGISVTAGYTATLEGTLWGSGSWANSTDWSGGGKTITGTTNLWGDPSFVNPAGGDYHIGPGSAAVDAGVDVSLTSDIDGDPRPANLGYDLGADERPGAALQARMWSGQRTFNTGQTLTYTFKISNTGSVTATNVIFTGTLPLYQRPVTATTGQPSACYTGTGWGAPITCTLGDVEAGQFTVVTTTVEVTSTQPGPLPYPMYYTVTMRGDNATGSTLEKLYLHNCHVRINGALPGYTEVQSAVDLASSGDTLMIAGLCAGTNERGGTRQVVYLDKSLTLFGGYNTDFSVWDPATYSTTLDGTGDGRVVFITGAISPTLQMLRMTGGDASGLGSDSEWRGPTDAGGGIYVDTATPTIRYNDIFSNTANYGGGLFLYNSDATLNNNNIKSNSANYGGGLYLDSSDASLSGNTIMSNTVITSGGGMYLNYSNATLSDNTVTSNTVNVSGGGMYLNYSNATLSGNSVTNNTAQNYGGGLVLNQSDATLNGNTIFSNTTQSFGGGLYLANSEAALRDNHIISNTAYWYGGGVYLVDSADTLTGNTIISNTAQGGGGLYLDNSPATLNGNTIDSNTADDGGGLFLQWGSNATLTNNVIARNRANNAGSGIYIQGSSPNLVHTTIAGNGSGGSGVYVTGYLGSYSTAALTNTILVSQTAGLTVTAGNVARLEGTLWGSGAWANGSDWGGGGTVITGTVNLWGDPDFVDPNAGDFHIGVNSAARDAGIDAGITTDMDGESRPAGTAHDIGADEFLASLSVSKQVFPNPGVPGGLLTYTIRVTNTSRIDLQATVTDTLPAHVTPTGKLTWTLVNIPTGGAWTQQVTVTVEISYTGVLTNVVRVTTVEGAVGSITHTVTITDMTILGLSATNDSPTALGSATTLTATISAGSSVTYTWDFGEGPVVPHLRNSGELNTLSGSGTGAVITHTYQDIGYYTAIVTAANSVSVLTSTMPITITDAPIAGLTATNDSPTKLGSPTTLTATISAGTSVYYDWSFGDGNYGYGKVVAHTYSNAGIYTAEIAADNSIGVVTTRTTVVVVEPIAGLTASNDSPTRLGSVTTLTATITGGSNVTYTWDLGGGESGIGAVVTHTYPSAGTYTATVTAANSLSTITATTTITITHQPYFDICLPLVLRDNPIGASSNGFPFVRNQKSILKGVSEQKPQLAIVLKG